MTARCICRADYSGAWEANPRCRAHSVSALAKQAAKERRGNRSSAVMAQRVEAHDSLDYFPTPPWATRALCERLADEFDRGNVSCWEPACGELHMVRPLAEYFSSVRASDVQAYTPMADLGRNEQRVQGPQLCDFLLTGRSEEPVDWIITNPPFNLAVEFIETAVKVAQRGVAMLVRTAFLESEARVTGLFARMPPSEVLVFAERVVMLKARLVRAGSVDPFAAKAGTKASTATSYAWLIWRWHDFGGDADTRLRWIAPCRRELERDGDYPDYREGAAGLMYEPQANVRNASSDDVMAGASHAGKGDAAVA